MTTVVVFESKGELAAAIRAELSTRGTTPATAAASPGEPLFSPSTGVGPKPLLVEFRSSSQTVMQRLRETPVAALVLDLNEFPRESIGLMRQVRSLGMPPAILAVGESGHQQLIPVLLESECSAVVTELPWDVAVAEWIRRVVTCRRTDFNDLHSR